MTFLWHDLSQTCPIFPELFVGAGWGCNTIISENGFVWSVGSLSGRYSKRHVMATIVTGCYFPRIRTFFVKKYKHGTVSLKFNVLYMKNQF